MWGAGAYFSPGNQLFYESHANTDSTQGTLEFWIKPRWYGSDGLSHYVLRYGGRGGLLFGKDGGGYWRSILNRWAGNELPEVGIGVYINDWLPDEWHHAAFTWNSESLKVYVDGKLKTQTGVTIKLPGVNEALFQIGGDSNSNYLDAVIDELRISSMARSENEIQSSFLAGIPIYGLEINPNPVKLLETWWKTPELVANTNFGTITIPPPTATWSTSDSNVASVNQQGLIVAISEGTVIISASVNGVSAYVMIHVARRFWNRK
ncbi:MAG: hypothetical protein JSW39_17980 [Desulfobacterales bacterium]|nr:MAG: hypothetical protein JSW39_17980 [Desulfobacterales bacterium]